MKKIKMPGRLKSAGKKFWKQVLSEYDLTESHDLERLAMAARCLDDLKEAEDRVLVDGRFTANRYGATIEHPGVKTIRDTRMLFIKIIRELGLDLVISGDSRPPRQY